MTRIIWCHSCHIKCISCHTSGGYMSFTHWLHVQIRGLNFPMLISYFSLKLFVIHVWRTRDFSTCQLPPCSFVVFLDDGRNKDDLHSIWWGWCHSCRIKCIPCHTSGDYMSFTHWLHVRIRALNFPMLIPHFSLELFFFHVFPFIFFKLMSLLLSSAFL